MTPSEFSDRMDGVALRQADRLDLEATSALFVAMTQATDKQGKPLIKKQKDLFDHEKVVNQILEQTKLSENYDELVARQRAWEKMQQILRERRKQHG